MRPPRPAQRFVAPYGAPRKALGGESRMRGAPSTAPRGPIRSSTEGPRGGGTTCVRHTQYSASWPHKGAP
eukprot:3872983-Pyramimonas_sp.AAC.1